MTATRTEMIQHRTTMSWRGAAEPACAIVGDRWTKPTGETVTKNVYGEWV